MKKFLAIVMLLLMTGNAFALSDAEYLRLKKSNADFAKADQRLSQVWKKLKGSVSKAVFAELQDLQRDWIASGRDIEAEDLMNEGYSRAEAYTIATNDRADELPDLAKSLARELRKRR